MGAGEERKSGGGRGKQRQISEREQRRRLGRNVCSDEAETGDDVYLYTLNMHCIFFANLFFGKNINIHVQVFT